MQRAGDVRLLYRSTDPTQTDLQPYDPENPPSDVATTTTDQGVEVPFVVRREQGFQDRDRYTILTLFRPGQAWSAWAAAAAVEPQAAGHPRRRLRCVVRPGQPAARGLLRHARAVPGVTPSYVTALGRGFAVLSTALDNTGHNCNVAMNAESVMMAKERLVERYGELRYTIGTGCSGGSIAQHTVANAYPGIYQGLITTCSYPDTFTAGAQFADYHLLRLYFEDPSRWAPGVVWLPTQMAQVEGHALPRQRGGRRRGPVQGRAQPRARLLGHRGPGGRRPGHPLRLRDQPRRRPLLGARHAGQPARPAAAGRVDAQEKAAGHGFGGIPFANTGVLYGLSALRSRA